MPIDAGIYSQIQQPQQSNPLAMLAQAQQIRHLQQQGDQADQAQQQQNRLLQLVQDPSFSSLPTAQKAQRLQSVGAFDQAGKMVTADAAANKDQRAADTSDFELKVKRLDAAANIAGSVTDQASYSRALPMMQDLGFDTSKFSPQYNPEGVKQFAMATLSAKDRLTNQTAIRGQDITMRGQDLTQGTALRGQDLSRQTSLETNANSVNATTRGQDLVNQRALDAQGNGKMTEDQGKATGWLVQAENAFKNMQANGFDAQGNPTSAAKPGINDALEKLPMVGGLANSMRSPERQKFIQASSSLSESLLRAATGAGVNESEAKQKIQELTPQFGEDAETTKQKMAAIPLYIESLKVRAGPGAAKADKVLASQSPGKPPKPDVGGMEAELRRRGLLK